MTEQHTTIPARWLDALRALDVATSGAEQWATSAAIAGEPQADGYSERALAVAAALRATIDLGFVERRTGPDVFEYRLTVEGRRFLLELEPAPTVTASKTIEIHRATPYLTIDVPTPAGIGKVLLTWRTARTATQVYVDVYAAYCAPADIKRFSEVTGIQHALNRIGRPGCVYTIRMLRAAGSATAAAVRAYVEPRSPHIAAFMAHCPDWVQKPKM